MQGNQKWKIDVLLLLRYVPIIFTEPIHSIIKNTIVGNQHRICDPKYGSKYLLTSKL